MKKDGVPIFIGVLLTILAFFLGVGGIAVFIGVGEATNNGIAAFAAVSFPFALLSGLFSWLVPGARWAVAGAMCAPVVVVCVLSGSMGVIYLLGAIWTAAITYAGAYLGARWSWSGADSQDTPPS